jgi:hypothetical protein
MNIMVIQYGFQSFNFDSTSMFWHFDKELKIKVIIYFQARIYFYGNRYETNLCSYVHMWANQLIYNLLVEFIEIDIVPPYFNTVVGIKSPIYFGIFVWITRGQQSIFCFLNYFMFTFIYWHVNFSYS